MSSSPFSSAPDAFSAGGAAAQLEDDYVRLSSRLLRQLQCRDTPAALHTAECIRDLCLHPGGSADNGKDSCETDAATAIAFELTPAHALLELHRTHPSVFASTEATSRRVEGSGPSPVPTSRNGSGSSGSGRSGTSHGVEGESDRSEATTSTASPRSGSSAGDDSDEEEEEENTRGERDTPTSEEEEATASQQQHNRQREFGLLVAALARWPQTTAAAAEAAAMGDGAVPLALHHTQQQQQQKAKNAQPSSKAPRRPVPVPPRDGAAPHGRRPGKKLPINVEGGKGQPTNSTTMPTTTAAAVVTVGGVSGSTEAKEEEEEEDEVTWKAMEQQVAKEMERLAVVRKHR